MNQEAIEKSKQVEELRRQGVSVSEAMRRVGIGNSTYYEVRKKMGLNKKKRAQKKTNQPFVEQIVTPIHSPMNTKLFCIIGSPHDLAQFIGGFQ